jgi:hypothetical protein
MAREMARNAERYPLHEMGVVNSPASRVHPARHRHHAHDQPGAAGDAWSRALRDGELWAMPDTLIGTDSHTPMVNGIGVLGWGVGGLEAESVMLGMPVMMRIPEVVGVRLAGRLRTASPRPTLPSTSRTACARQLRRALRRILRPRRRHAFRRRAFHHRQHGARIWLVDRLFPGRRATLDYLRQTGPLRSAHRPGGKLRAGDRACGSIPPPSRATPGRRVDLGTVFSLAVRPAPPAGSARPRRGPRSLAAGIAFGGTAVQQHPGHAGRHRRDHQLHQHLRSAPADRGRPARPQGARARPQAARLGQDLLLRRVAHRRADAEARGAAR